MVDLAYRLVSAGSTLVETFTTASAVRNLAIDGMLVGHGHDLAEDDHAELLQAGIRAPAGP